MKPRYTVIWQPDVERDFAERWLDADPDERHWYTTLASAMDVALAAKADRLGVPSEDDPRARVWRIPGIAPPVWIVYSVREEDRLVFVVRIRIEKG